jgi:hypothetical protein
LIARIRRWWNRTFGPDDTSIVDMPNVHDMLVATLKEWEENFSPDEW